MNRAPRISAHRPGQGADRFPEVDAQLDRTLRVLGSVQPPSGLQQRTLARLENQFLPLPAEATTASHDSSLKIVQRWIAPLGSVPGTLAALLAAALLIALGLGLGFRTPTPKAARAALAAQKSATTLRRSALLAPAASPGNAPRSRAHSRQVSTVPRVMTGLPASPKLDDFHAPSQPAPALPLTDQELLAMRMVRRGQGTQLSELELARDPQVTATEKAAFHEFFDPGPEVSVDQPLEAGQPGVTNQPADVTNQASDVANQANDPVQGEPK